MRSSIAIRVARQLMMSSAVHHGRPAFLAPRRHDGGCASMTHLGGGVRENGDTAGKHEAMRGLPEVRHSLIEEESIPTTEEELAKRRAAALRRWLENEMGEERASLTALLAKHGVKMRGGAEEAKAFVEELLEWKAEGMMARLEGDDTKNAKP